MMILTAKISKSKLLVIALLLIAVILVLTLCMKHTGPAEQAPEERSVSAKTDEQRTAFLLSYGWQVQPTPVLTQEVAVPQEPNEVFLRYNELQKAQGFDLMDYAGKTVSRYVYEITNYPDEGVYRATLLVYRGKIIGGDVCAARKGGVMHGFQMPG